MVVSPTMIQSANTTQKAYVGAHHGGALERDYFKTFFAILDPFFGHVA